jgi:hypothetical protein
MVSGLIQQQDIGVHQHGTGQLELHLPTTGEGTDRVLLLLGVETDVGESGTDVIRGGEETLISEYPVDNGDIGLGTVNVVLNVESSDDRWVWETFDLTVDDGVHEGRFTGTVTTTETVSVTTLETEGSHVEQDLGTVREGEGTVTQVLSSLLVIEHTLVLTLFVGLLLEEVTDHGQVVNTWSSELEVLGKSSLPSGLIVVVSVYETGGKDTGVSESCVGSFWNDGSLVLYELANEVDGEVRTLGDLERWEVGTVTLWDLCDLTQGLDGTVNDTTSFRVSDGL